MPPHQSGIFHTAQQRKRFFFLVSPLASEEKARSSRSPKERAYVLSVKLQVGIDLRKCVSIAFSSKSLSFGSMLSLVSATGRSFAWLLHRSICFVRFRASGLECKKTSSFQTEDIIQEELFFNLGRILPIDNRVGTAPDTT